MPAVIGWLHLEDEPALDETEFLRDKLPSYDNVNFEPGSEGVYTNVGYYTLASVIEQVTGQSYEEYVVEHVLDPLGMVNTRFEYTDAMLANEGVGAHPMADIQTLFVPIMSPPWPSDYIREYDDGWIWLQRFLFDGNAPSGLIGPAPEKARLVAAILNGGELEGGRILSEESVDTMLNERHVEAGSSPEADEYSDFDEMVHGIGWFVVRDGGRLHHSHTGGGPGFAALMRLYPDEDLGIVILANGTNLEYHDIADAIAEIEW
jgi:CubicO group peptidase (beta-lactamase class C family)